ncbi:hypothetical protein [Alcaligenes sp. SDU_A2]|uniref:hypothetical protein n=1 Tax=Alcaligenes sp. SDU_A2 TaxID=3136634 RepID=UPI00311EC0D3
MRLKKESLGRDFLIFALITALFTLGVAVFLYFYFPDFYRWLGSRDFVRGEQEGVFDLQSYTGVMQIVLGMPIALAGSVYAIYLARQSMNLSRLSHEQTQALNRNALSNQYKEKLNKASHAFHELTLTLRDLNLGSLAVYSMASKAINFSTSMWGAGPEGSRESMTAAGQQLFQTLERLRAALEVIYADPALRQLLEARLRNANLIHTIDQDWLKDSDRQDLPLLNAVLASDYLAISDHLAQRARSLHGQELIMASLEALAGIALRWSLSDEHRTQNPQLLQHLLDTDINDGAEVANDYAEEFGLRFLGVVLLKYSCSVRLNSPLPHDWRIDLGTAAFVDLIKALPSREDIKQCVDNQEGQLLHDLRLLHVDTDAYIDLVTEPKRSLSSVLQYHVQQLLDIYPSYRHRMGLIRPDSQGEPLRQLGRIASQIAGGQSLSQDNIQNSIIQVAIRNILEMGDSGVLTPRQLRPAVQALARAHTEPLALFVLEPDLLAVLGAALSPALTTDLLVQLSELPMRQEQAAARLQLMLQLATMLAEQEQTALATQTVQSASELLGTLFEHHLPLLQQYYLEQADAPTHCAPILFAIVLRNTIWCHPLRVLLEGKPLRARMLYATDAVLPILYRRFHQLNQLDWADTLEQWEGIPQPEHLMRWHQALQDWLLNSQSNDQGNIELDLAAL